MPWEETSHTFHCQGIHPQKKYPPHLFILNRPILYMAGRGEEEEDDDDKSLGQIIMFLVMTDYCMNFSLETSFIPCGTEG